MNINGEEIGFALTVGASVQIAKICPGNDIKRLTELLNKNKDDYIETVEIMNTIMKCMNGGFVAGEKLKGNDAVRLTDEMLETLTTDEYQEMQKEALRLFKKDGKGEVNAERIPEKGKKEKTEAEK